MSPMVEPDLSSQWPLWRPEGKELEGWSRYATAWRFCLRGQKIEGPASPLMPSKLSSTGESEEWVWVSSPEMPQGHLLGCAFWETGTQEAETGIVSRDLSGCDWLIPKLDQDQWLWKWPQRCQLEGASCPKALWWKWCLSLARVLGPSSWGTEDQEVMFEKMWRDVVVSGENLVTCSLTFWSKWVRGALMRSQRKETVAETWSVCSSHGRSSAVWMCIRSGGRFCLWPSSHLFTWRSEECEMILFWILGILLIKVGVFKG